MDASQGAQGEGRGVAGVTLFNWKGACLAMTAMIILIGLSVVALGLACYIALDLLREVQQGSYRKFVTHRPEPEIPRDEKPTIGSVGIRNWHPGKIFVLWVLDFSLLLMLWEPCPRRSVFGTFGGSRCSHTDEVLLWLLLSIPVIVITWRWASARERQWS